MPNFWNAKGMTRQPGPLPVSMPDHVLKFNVYEFVNTRGGWRWSYQGQNSRLAHGIYSFVHLYTQRKYAQGCSSSEHMDRSWLDRLSALSNWSCLFREPSRSSSSKLNFFYWFIYAGNLCLLKSMVVTLHTRFTSPRGFPSQFTCWEVVRWKSSTFITWRWRFMVLFA